MFKKAFKEIVIVLLLIIAIALVLGVILYDYIPTGKIVPVIEAYEIPQNIKNEINENIQDTENETIITYTIDENDLINYEKGKDYQKGKINPFSQYTTKEPVEQNSTGSTNGNTNSNNSNNNTNNQNSTNTVKQNGQNTVQSGLK